MSNTAPAPSSGRTVVRRPATAPTVTLPVVQAPTLPRLTVPSPTPFASAGAQEPDEREEQDYEVGDPTALPTPTARWLRTPRTAHATRSDGIVVWHEGSGWHITVRGEPCAFIPEEATPANLEYCIGKADEVNPPEPWVLEDGVWKASVWRVLSSDGLTWGVFRDLNDKLERASRQPFLTADRARRWAELRFDRGSAGLRGPKPRAGARAKAKLPDVRVTVDERDRVLSVLERAGLSYADLVRASAYWVEENIVGSNAGWEVERLENGVVRFARRAV